MKDFKANYLIVLLIASIFVGSLGLLSYNKYTESSIRGKKAQVSSQVLRDMAEFKSLALLALAEKRILHSASGSESNFSFYSREADKLISKLAVETFSQQSIKIQEIRRRYDSLVQSASAIENKQAQAEFVSFTNDFIAHEEVIFNGRLSKLVSLNKNFFIAIVVGSFAAFVILLAMNYYLLLARKRSAILQKNFDEFREKQAQSLQATKDGIFEWKLREQDVYWSPRLKEMIGYSDEELKASSENLEQLMHPEDRDTYWQDVHKHLRGDSAEHSAFFRWKHKNGNWIWINSRGRAVFNEYGDPVKLIGVHTDVTKLKEYELQLDASKTEAEKANSAKSDFLAHMSHEIRTPLTAITGVAEILNMQSDKFDEKTKRLLDALNNSAIGLKDLISDILDYSKIESGRITLESKEIELAELFDQIISIFAEKTAEKELEFSFDFEAIKNIRVIGDLVRIRQILINLIGNAVKFTNAGFVHVVAEIVTSGNIESLKVSVSDSGIGIRSEHLPYIFDSFRQADASISRKFGGTGLGLPISRHLAKLMGGDIVVQSVIGEGSVFTLFIPMQKADTHIELQAANLTEKRLALKDEDKILIVEDYEGNIAFITHLMDEMNVRYDLARTGLEALKLWGETPYKLILMDIQMPEMDGISAIKHIRQIEKESADKNHIPVIAMTAHAFQEDRGKCLSAGFDDYLPKPLSKDDLFEKMSQLISQYG